MQTEEQPHIYLSTACLHKLHAYCQAQYGHAEDTTFNYKWPKKPAECKFCDAPCVCECHTTRS